MDFKIFFMFFFRRSPWLLKKIFSSCTWKGEDERAIYLTFDDGPHPEITIFVLEQLRKYRAKATFFVIGKNVKAYPEVYRRILDEGHRVGNHTFSHLNGWKSKDKDYLEDIDEAKKYIDSHLFRPPYGKATRFQLRQLENRKYDLRCIMWSLLSADFDRTLSPQKCLDQLVVSIKGGDIVVFHDSEKAWERLQFVLPLFLQHCYSKGYHFLPIT